MDASDSGVDQIIELSSEALDVDVLQDLLESLSEPAAVLAVYRKFVANAAAFIAELAGQDDAARIETLHTLKGSAAMMGARRMAELAAHLQAQPPRSRVQVEQATGALEGELARFRLAVDARLSALGVSPGL